MLKRLEKEMRLKLQERDAELQSLTQKVRKYEICAELHCAYSVVCVCVCVFRLQRMHRWIRN